MKQTGAELDIGSMVYRPGQILMNSYDGDAIYAELAGKIRAGREITDIDMVNLIFLPLMRNTTARDELAENSIRLAQTIPDKTKRDTCILAAFAFGNKYLDETRLNRIKEALKMTNLAMIYM